MSTEEVLIEFEKPKTGHNAGDLQFGPDGYLWVSLGEAGMYSSGNAEKLKGSLLGSILRIDVRNPSKETGYSIPEDNPRFADASVPPEVYVTGLRNPWRWNFIDDKTLLTLERGWDRATGKNTILIHKVSTLDAKNTLDTFKVEKLNSDQILKKELVLDLDSILPKLSKGFQKLDNIEGIALGPKLPNGNQTLILTSDNNFRPNQRTLFFALEIVN